MFLAYDYLAASSPITHTIANTQSHYDIRERKSIVKVGLNFISAGHNPWSRQVLMSAAETPIRSPRFVPGFSLARSSALFLLEPCTKLMADPRLAIPGFPGFP